MINKDHIKKFYDCQKYTPSIAEFDKLKLNITSSLPLLNAFKEHYNLKSPAELKDKTYAFAQVLLKNIAETGFIDSNLYELQAIDLILKDTSFITKKYEKLKDAPNTHMYYTSQLNRTLDLVLINAISEVNSAEDIGKKCGLSAKTTVQDLYKIFNDTETVKVIQKTVLPILKESNMKDKIITLLKMQKTTGEAFIKEQQIKSIGHLSDFFQSLGCLDIYLKSYNSNSKKFGYQDLTYEMETNSFLADTIGLKEAFSPEFLRTLSVRDLSFFTAHWQNRFAKEALCLQMACIAIDSLDLWRKIFNGEQNFTIGSKALTAVIQKYRFLHALYVDSYAHSQEKIKIKEQNGIEVTPDNTEDFSEYYSQLCSYLGKDYQNYFSTYLHGENDFAQDVNYSGPFINLETLTYRKKQSTLEPLIKIMLDNPSCRNWGIIRNDFVDGKLIDSINTNRNMILLAFDIEGFNMPFRFHLPKDSLIDLVKLNNPLCLIPEYQGHADFLINNEIVPSNIIMPIPKRHRSIIKANALEASENQDYWQHLNFLVNGKFPKHLQETAQKSKKQAASSRLPITYTSLINGKRYVKTNKDQYIEVDSYAR